MRIVDRLRFYWTVATDDMVNHAQSDYGWFRSTVDALEPYVGSIKGKTILDFGCGRRYPLTLLLHNFGNKVVGVDPRYVGINTPFIARWWKALRADGVWPRAKQACPRHLAGTELEQRQVASLCWSVSTYYWANTTRIFSSTFSNPTQKTNRISRR